VEVIPIAEAEADRYIQHPFETEPQLSSHYKCSKHISNHRSLGSRLD